MADTQKEAKKETKKERPANCAKCNTRIRRKNWYYRNGSYFCGKTCSGQFMTEQDEKKAEEKKKAEEEKQKAAEEKAKAGLDETAKAGEAPATAEKPAEAEKRAGGPQGG